MKLCIDVKECKKEKLPVDTALYMAAIYLKTLITPKTFQDVCRRGYIEFDGFDKDKQPVNARLTSSGMEMIESIFLNSEYNSEEEDERFKQLASALRELYPKGKKEGTAYMWRDSEAIIIRKLKSFVKKYDPQEDYTSEQIIEATKRYVQSFNGDYRFMQLLKYFISKKDVMTGEENSQLLSYLENEGSTNVNDSWRDSIR